jgi:hypothetical protein
MVQQEITQRSGMPANNSLGIFARRVVCGSCGGLFGAKVWHSKDKYRRVIMQCNAKYGAGKHCATPHVTEDMLKEAFVEALNRLVTDREAVIEDISLLLPKLADTAALTQEKETAVRERDELRSQVQQCIEDNASEARDQQAYNDRFQRLMSDLEAGKEKVSEIEEKLRQRMIRGETLRQFMTELGERSNLITHFDEAAWLTLADRVTITVDGDAVFRFRCGAETGIKLR